MNQLAAKEDAFLNREFLAPALPGGTVGVRIGGVHCQVKIEPNDFTGWGVFQPVSHKQAMLVRPANLTERRKYLELFPTVRLIVCARAGDGWLGSAASFGDSRFQLEGLAPLQLAHEVQLFDCVRARYDGARFWFDEIDGRHDPAIARYLREAISQPIEPDDLHKKGLTAEERAAYEFNYFERMQPEEDAETSPQRNPPHRRRSQRDRNEDPVRRRLRESLSHAGAELVDYLERADGFRVRYNVRGRQYTSSVNKDDLTVQVAGICLSGEDQKFDLASMVGVLTQGDPHGGVLRVGDDGMDEDEYWRVHPPQE